MDGKMGPSLRSGGGEGLTAHERAHEEYLTEVTCVCEAARECADEEEEKDLDRTDPGDVAWWPIQSCYVVGLEDSEGVDEAPKYSVG